MSLDVGQLSLWVLRHIVATTKDFVFDQHVFEKTYSRVEQLLSDNPDVASVWVPIFGFDASDADFSLSEGCVLRRMTNHEVSILIRTAAIPVKPSGTALLVKRAHQWAIAAEVPLQRVVGERRLGNPQPLVADPYRAAQNLVAAMRLVMGGRPTFGGAFETYDDPSDLMGSSTTAHVLPTVVGTTVDVSPLAAEQVRQVLETHLMLNSAGVRGSKFLQVAIRRIGDCGTRLNLEDHLIDLVVCAEAIYLSDASSKAALSHRASIRAAIFYEGSDRDAARRFIKSAYDVRSQVVHGGILVDKKLVNFAGKKCTLKDFVDDLDEFMRGAILRAVTIISQGGTLSWNDWESAMLIAAPALPATQATTGS